jgi:hypothetical protein
MLESIHKSFHVMIWHCRKEDAIDINESLADAYQVTSTYLFEIIMKVSGAHESKGIMKVSRTHESK